MKKLISILFLFNIVILGYPKIVLAIELCEKSDEYKAYEKLSKREKEGLVSPLYCKGFYGSKKTQFGKGLNSSVSNSIASPYYNANDEGIVTEVKNQYNVGACWAFSAISVVETNALKNDLSEYDFSEAHMIYGLLQAGYNTSDVIGRKGKYATDSINVGGKAYFPASYYFNNSGQLLEDEMEYPKNPKIISSSDYPIGKSMITVDKFEINNINSYGICSINEINNIKQRVLDYGSVQALVYFDDNLFADSGLNYYLATTNNSASSNHAVVIVGWDDNLSKSNFNGATRNGAWIVKNSYGKTWSNDGYFYVSYDDNFVCKYVASYTGVSDTTFENTYKASDLISFSSGFTLNGTLYLSSKFEKETDSKETIKRISFAVGDNTSYMVYLSRDNIKNDMSNWVLLGSGYSDSLSVRSIAVNTELINDDFTIIIKYVSDSGITTALPAMCSNDEDVANLTYSSDKNYYSNNVISWHDMYSLSTNLGNMKCEPIIYAYTDKTSEEEPQNIDSITAINDKSSIIDDNVVLFAVPKDNTLTPTNISSYITINGEYTIVDSNENAITDNIGTGSKIKFQNKDYTIVILGDVTGDGRVNSGDLLKIVKYLKNATSLNNYQYKAGDTTKDEIINSGDLLRLIKYLKGTVFFTA